MRVSSSSMALNKTSSSSNFSSFRMKSLTTVNRGFECRSEIVKHLDLQCVLDNDTLLFDTSLERIVLGAILCHVFTCGVGELVHRNNGCPLTCGVLKRTPLFQPFPEVMSEPV